MSHPVPYAEPADKSIVGWGDPLMAVWFRDDAAVGTGHGPDDRWFIANGDGTYGHPYEWATVCYLNAANGRPFLLARCGPMAGNA